MRNSNHLLVINYAMDSSHPLLSHQTTVVKELAKHFSRITVITNQARDDHQPSNVKTISLDWQVGRPIVNYSRFIKLALLLLLRERVSFVFAHMTEIHSALLAPFTKVFRVRHLLWYAHTHKSFAFLLASKLVDAIATSTSGSCPISTPKVRIIGQAINPGDFFPRDDRDYLNLTKFIHIGRIDKSKRIDVLIDTVKNLRMFDSNISLCLVGSTANRDSLSWSLNLNQRKDVTWLKMVPAIPREKVLEALNKHDLFIHGYLGSLDKSVVEATMASVPVVTSNPEYLKIFGSWNPETFISLEDEFMHLRNSEVSWTRQEVVRRRQIALQNHSFDSWVWSVVSILKQS